MADLAALQVQLELQTAKFEEGMGRVTRDLNRLNRNVNGATGSLKSFGAALAGIGAGTMAVQIFNKIVTDMDKINKSSQKLGVTTEALSALGYAAEQSGSSFEGLEIGLKVLSKNLADVDKGTNDAAKALRALGVTAKDSTEEAFLKIAKGLSSIPDGATKAAVAMAIFGKSGADLVPLLNEGEDGIKKLMQRAQELGLVVKKETADSFTKFGDAMDDIGKAMRGVANEILSGMMPALSNMTADFADANKVGDEFKVIGKGIAEVLKVVAVLAVNTGYVIKQIGNEIGGLAAQAALVAQLDFKGAAAIGTAMKEDAARARKEVDVLSERIMGMGQSSEKAAPKIARTNTELEKILRTSVGASTATKAAKEFFDALTPKQQLTADFAKIAEGVGSAKVQLEALADPRYIEFLKSFGVTTEQIAAQMDKLRNQAGMPLMDQQVKMWEEQQKAIEDTVIAAKALDTQWSNYVPTVEALIKAWESGAISLEAMNTQLTAMQGKNPFATMAEGSDKTLELLDAINDKIGQSLNTAVNGLIDNLGKAKISFKDFAEAFLKDIGKMIIQMTIMKTVEDSLKSFGGGSKGFIGFLGGLLGGARADGGPVQAGRAYLVGERGKELFVPNQNGSIISNQDMRNQSSRNVNVTINQYISGTSGSSDLRRAVGSGAREALSMFAASQRYA
jgi:hypothetical protein